MISAELSRKLREAFPSVTVKRIEHLWRWVVAMPDGEVMLPDPDLVSTAEVIVCLHLARHLAYRDRAAFEQIIKRLSAKKKRYLYPQSYADRRPRT